MNGFFVRATAQADRAAREVERVAKEVEASGLAPVARLLQTVAAHLRLMARAGTAADEGALTYDRVAQDTDDAYRAVSQCALQLRVALLLEASCDLEKVAKVLAALHRDALADTQPINRPPSLDDGD